MKQKDPRKAIPLITQIAILILILNPFFFNAIRNNQIWPFMILMIGIIILFFTHKMKKGNIPYLKQWANSTFFSFGIFLILGSYFLISLVGKSIQEKILFELISGVWILIASLIFLIFGIKAKRFEKITK